MTEANSFTVETDKCLQALNTLALPAKASHFCTLSKFHHVKQALDFATDNDLTVIPLGAGSNIVLASNLTGLVLSLNLLGITEQKGSASNNDTVDVTFGAGENWHNAVIYTLKQGWYGLENLSLIPGNSGAAAIQNIGAYGVELADVLVSLKAVDIESGALLNLTNQECKFGYRDSIFKQSLKDKCIITEITLRLTKTPMVNLDYPALRAYFPESTTLPSPLLVSDAVCQIRRSKLPDPKELPNVGSFFKNPIVSADTLGRIQKEHSALDIELPFYPQDDGSIKIPAAWLVEYCQFKGFRRGSVGVHKDQALVLVNYNDVEGSDSAREILQLAQEIQRTVETEFGIELEVEPRVYGSL